MESVIQSEKKCFACGRVSGLHSHHIYGGTANRKISEKYGYKAWLCPHHHNMSNEGVHFNRDFDLHLKRMAQRHFEENHGTREGFIKIFGRSYL